MPYEQHSRMVASGVVLDQTGQQQMEIWSWSVAFTSTGGSALLNEAQRAAVATAVQTYHSAATSRISTVCHLRSIKINDFGPAGAVLKQTNNPTNEVSVDIAGGSGALPNWPLQCAVAISLDSGLRGASRRGRWYMPPISGPDTLFTGQYRLLAAVRDDLATSAANFLDACLAGGARPIIASGIVGNVPVKSVRVGDVIDTMRTRRNALLEGYSASQLVH